MKVYLFLVLTLTICLLEANENVTFTEVKVANALSKNQRILFADKARETAGSSEVRLITNSFAYSNMCFYEAIVISTNRFEESFVRSETYLLDMFFDIEIHKCSSTHIISDKLISVNQDVNISLLVNFFQKLRDSLPIEFAPYLVTSSGFEERLVIYGTKNQENIRLYLDHNGVELIEAQ